MKYKYALVIGIVILSIYVIYKTVFRRFTLKVDDYFGRFGNNVIQIVNATDLATRKYNYLKLPSHNYFDTKGIEQNIAYKNSFTRFEQPEEQPDGHLFFCDSRDQDNEQLVRNIILDSFSIRDYPTIPSSTLIIHIRSGDIFVDAHPYYAQPPLSFYTNIIDNNNYENIVIVSENKLNPIIDILLERYSNATYNERSFEEDIKLLLGAEHIVQSIGSFVPAITYLSNCTKKVYKTHNPFSDEQQPIVVGTSTILSNEPYEVVDYTFDEYFEKMGDWENSPLQLEMMKRY